MVIPFSVLVSTMLQFRSTLLPSDLASSQVESFLNITNAPVLSGGGIVVADGRYYTDALLTISPSYLKEASHMMR